MPDDIDILARDLAVAMPAAGDWHAFDKYVSLIAKRVRECVKEQQRKHAEIAAQWADNYPESVWPEIVPFGENTAPSGDRIAASASRYSAERIAAAILAHEGR
jgi:hypothetical protein